MLIPLLILSATWTSPSDVIYLLHRRSGWAFLPKTGSEFKIDFVRKRSDEVALKNFAARNWSLQIPSKGGAAIAITLPIGDLFDPFAASIRTSSVVRPTSYWSLRSGRWTNASEILTAGNISIERCHWTLRNRKVLARFDLSNLSTALPDLALAIGGEFRRSTGTIEFSPRTFRRQALASLPNPASSSDDASKLGILRLGLRHASDVELQNLFASPQSRITVKTANLDKDETLYVSTYLRKAIRSIEISIPGEGDAIRAKIREWGEPSVFLRASGAAALAFSSPDGKKRIFL